MVLFFPGSNIDVPHCRESREHADPADAQLRELVWWMQGIEVRPRRMFAAASFPRINIRKSWVRLPRDLHQFTFGDDFDQGLDNVSMPSGLQQFPGFRWQCSELCKGHHGVGIGCLPG